MEHTAPSQRLKQLNLYTARSHEVTSNGQHTENNDWMILSALSKKQKGSLKTRAANKEIFKEGAQVRRQLQSRNTRCPQQRVEEAEADCSLLLCTTTSQRGRCDVMQYCH